MIINDKDFKILCNIKNDINYDIEISDQFDYGVMEKDLERLWDQLCEIIEKYEEE